MEYQKDTDGKYAIRKRKIIFFGVPSCLMLYIVIASDSTCDRLCGLVGRIPGYRSRDPDSIPGAIRFSE
jgi:hypothetical protein